VANDVIRCRSISVRLSALIQRPLPSSKNPAREAVRREAEDAARRFEGSSH
jgi:hypothetical protein